MKDLIEKLRKDADEIEACGAGLEAQTMREAADKLEELGRKTEKRFVVWNDDRSEGFVTDDEEDAKQAKRGRFRMVGSALGEAFFEMYSDHNRTIEEITVDSAAEAE